MANPLEVNIYVIVSETGRVRTSKNPPRLNKDEIPIRLRLSIPRKMFERPLIQATVKVDEAAIIPKEISPEILISTADLIEQQTGMKVELTVIQPEKKEPEIEGESNDREH